MCTGERTGQLSATICVHQNVAGLSPRCVLHRQDPQVQLQVSRDRSMQVVLWVWRVSCALPSGRASRASCGY